MTTKLISSINGSCMRDATRIFNSIKPHHGRADVLVYGVEKKAYRFVFYQDSGCIFIKPVTINKKTDQKEEYIVMRKDIRTNVVRKMIEKCPDISKDTVTKLYIYLLEILNCIQRIMFPKIKEAV